MATQRFSTLRQPFILREEDVRKIENVFRREFESLVISVRFADELTQDFETVDEVLEVENAKDRRIQRVEFRSGSRKDDEFGRLSLGKASDGPVQIQFIMNNAESARRFNDNLIRRLEGMKPWYSGIETFGIPLVPYALALLAVPYIVFCKELAEFKAVNDTVSNIFIFCCLFAISMGCHENGLSLFPLTVFAVGQGKERLERLQLLRRSILGIIVTAIVLPILKSLIFD